MRLASRAMRCDSLHLQRTNKWPHLPWMESLARLSNTHGQVATRPPTAFAKNANRALPWSRTSTGLTGHIDSYPLAKQRNLIPIDRGDCDQKNAKYYARGLDQSTSRW